MYNDLTGPSRAEGVFFEAVNQKPEKLIGSASSLLFIYLEPKWPLFWLEKSLVWGVDLQK